MKPTYYSKNYRFHLYLYWFVAIFGMTVTAAITLYSLYTHFFLYLWSDLITLWLIILCGKYIIYLTREYAFDKEGITICYAKRWNKFYSWEEVADISVCRDWNGGRQSGYFDVILVRFGQPTAMPPKTKLGSINAHDMFFALTVEFSRERLQEIQKFYKGEIIDYRPTGLYVPPPREEYR